MARRLDDLSPIPASQITPKEVFLDRRRFLAAAAATAAAGLGATGEALAEDIAMKLPAPRNMALSIGDAPTTKKIITNYNNFYEFGMGKTDPAASASAMKTRPWTIQIGGAVEKPMTLGIEDILKMPLEERVYRFRCVEAWSMVVPWIGIEFNKIAALVSPTSNAKFVKFTTITQLENMPGVRGQVIDFPYVEGLRIDEAMHPLAMLTVGLYGETLPNQNGAPVRMIVPWKYGFKSAKSIVRIDFVEEQPTSTWMKILPGEYGFYSNVNPAVDHPRWSQARERRLPDFFASTETLPFNGYATQVAALYAGMDLKKYY